MAALVEGCQYGLSSYESTSADKTTLHVKLTEHALKAIEEFQKIKVSYEFYFENVRNIVTKTRLRICASQAK